MPSRLYQELPYRADSAERFSLLAQDPWSVYLDSCRPCTDQGRYDILAADPYLTLVTRGEITEIRTRGGVEFSREDPFTLLRRALGAVTGGATPPFQGGAIGYFGYDLAWRLERLPRRLPDAWRLPEMAVGLYDWALVVDHETQRAWLAAQGRDPATIAKWDGLVQRLGDAPWEAASGRFRVAGTPQTEMTWERYADAFRRIQRYIREGDCYQVNLARCFTVSVTGDPWILYRALRRANPAPFGAFLRTPDAAVLSCSPERFLKLGSGVVETRPIKGTRPRSAVEQEDRRQARALYASPKDRAENLMIVDLLRNDLGKSCVPGSVRVPELFKIESFATVHHLVSTVRGKLAAGQDALGLLRGCFPGGSITGAPKIRAMEIIEELEFQRRGVYCGAIGYIGFDGAMDTNIAIRTLVQQQGSLSFWGGGGIVADSDPEAEFRETRDKIAVVLELLKRPEFQG